MSPSTRVVFTEDAWVQEAIMKHAPIGHKEEMACKMIKRERMNSRLNYNTKCIIVQTNIIEDGFKVTCRSIIKIHKKSGNISMGHCLRFKGITYFPSTNRRRACTDRHTLKQYEKHLETSNKWHKQHWTEYYQKNKESLKKQAREYYHRSIEAGTDPNKNQQEIQFYETVGYEIGVLEIIHFNIISGKVSVTSRFRGFRDTKLYIVKEKV